MYSVVIGTNNQKKLTVAQNAMYNFIGAIVYSVCQWVISSLLVVHLSPEEMSLNNTGLLQLSMSVTNIFYALALYSVRTFQVSEVENKYSNADYVGARFITMGISLLLCFGYSLSFGYSKKDILCIMFYMCYKLTEAFCDVLHGIDQKNYRMDYVGVSYVVRGIVSMFAFAAAILITSNIIISIVAMAVSTLIIAVLYDVPKASRFGSIKPSFNKKNIISLLGVCLPAVVASMAFIAITSIPRQTLEAMYDKDTLGYYGTIAAPLVVVQVMATSIFNPMLTELSHHYKNGEIRKFIMRLAKNLITLIVIASIICAGVAVLGKFAVGLVFGQKFVPYTYLMYGIIGCTTLYVISWLCTSTLIIMRRMNVCMIASIIALGVSVLLAKPMINLFEMNGVSFSIIIAYAIHIVVSFVVIYKNLRLKRKEI